ncbi:hypothetical protein CBR_g3473 [Chara braunii]|uniref:AAA+ ATPase domain-containing protein n=1 Tax=Chara braunii TaxID=69332 RepID=A0A388JR21_CHABU|nr:hypothetical protein CBR_g3473 [Chara braunii]|eukprot:GBG60230.1 hypothetical protein CBR_g3473 [Chara braunii]
MATLRHLLSGLSFAGTAAGGAVLCGQPTVALAERDDKKDKQKDDESKGGGGGDRRKDTAVGFDPEALERGAKALREMNASPHSKKVFELMRKQEDTRQTEEKAKIAEFQALQAQREIEKQKVLYEEQRKTMQQQAQTKAQLARYEDELARKRMQADHEAQRARNAELVKMQEESAQKQEAIRRMTEEQIQQQRRATEREKAELERETLRMKAMADAEARAHEARLSEDINRRRLIEKANLEKDKWIAAINTTFSHIGGGVKDLLTDRDKLVVTVAGGTALAAGIYTTREGARVVWGYIERILGQPSLIRESSRGKFPWSGLKRAKSGTSSLMTEAATSTESSSTATTNPANGVLKTEDAFGEVILHPALLKRVKQLAVATANTRRHSAPFRNILFYGPPGTGKTMAAKHLATTSGLEYAMMTGGDVAPLGPAAVTKIHDLFDWANKTRKGLLLFIDEADAFLCERNNTRMSEAQRSALNALLYRTGDQSRDIVLVLATNRPEDLDTAIADRMDEALEFPLPGWEEREKLIRLYLTKYVLNAPSGRMSGGKIRSLLWGATQNKIEVKGITPEVIREAAEKTEGFSGRMLAKMMASVQGAVYGSLSSVLDAHLFREVVDYKVAEFKQRRQLAQH